MAPEAGKHSSPAEALRFSSAGCEISVQTMGCALQSQSVLQGSSAHWAGLPRASPAAAPEQPHAVKTSAGVMNPELNL